MAKDPAVLFYTADFLVGTYGFSMQERGEYITLLCLQHQQGHLSEDTVRSIASSASVIDKFLRDPHGRYYNERLDVEKTRREAYAKSRSRNGSKGGRPKNPKNTEKKPYGFHMQTECKPYEKHSENENINNSNTKALSNTTDMSIAEDIPNTIFPFSNTTTTTTTTTTGSCLKARTRKKNVENSEEERDEDGLTSREFRIIERFFEDETGEDSFFSTVVNDLILDFVAYNKSKSWRGIGGEDVRNDLGRYLRRWIDEERAKRSKYQRS